MELHKVIGRHSRQVKTLGPDVDRSGSWQDLEDPEGASGGGPGIAEDGLVFTVDQSGVGRVRFESESGSRLVERLFNSTTFT